MVKEYLECLMLSGSYNGRYISLKNKLENIMLLVSDKHPKSREDSLQVLNHYRYEEGKWGLIATRETQEEVLFLHQGGGNKKNQNYRPRKNSKGRLDCLHCKKTDHWAYQCPDLTPEKHADLKAA